MANEKRLIDADAVASKILDCINEYHENMIEAGPFRNWKGCALDGLQKASQIICVSCVHRKVCKGIDNQPCVECNQFLNEDKKPQTNADRIRAMSDEELAGFLEDEDWLCSTYNCCSACPMKGEGTKCLSVLEWLKQPVEEST